MIRKMFDNFLMAGFPFRMTLLAMLGLFGGCSILQSTPQSSTVAVETSCATIGASVQVLALARANGKLNDTVVKSTDSLIAITEPVCTAPEKPTLSSAETSVFINAAAELAKTAATYQGSK